MDTKNLEAVYIKAFEQNREFMEIVGHFPADIYEQRSSWNPPQRGCYDKYAGYKELVHFHAPKLLFLPPATPGARSLDVGGGAGYLAFMLRTLGYDPCIIDVPEKDDFKIMTRMREALNIPTYYHYVRPLKPLPHLPHEPYSLITATNLVFDLGWNWREYNSLLRDMASRMTKDGAIYLYFNPPQAEKIWSDPGFLGKFTEAGAECVVPRRALLFRDISALV